jgi:hypothetical protein
MEVAVKQIAMKDCQDEANHCILHPLPSRYHSFAQKSRPSVYRRLYGRPLLADAVRDHRKVLVVTFSEQNRKRHGVSTTA